MKIKKLILNVNEHGGIDQNQSRWNLEQMCVAINQLLSSACTVRLSKCHATIHKFVSLCFYAKLKSTKPLKNQTFIKTTVNYQNMKVYNV